MGKIRKLLLITGLSGAGMSSALRNLEDLGYTAIDNLPISMIENLINDEQGIDRPIAIGVDCRTWDFDVDDVIDTYKRLSDRPDLDVELVMITCNETILQKRYTETRRRHPLAIDRPIIDGIRKEIILTEKLKNFSSHVFDTTELSSNDFRTIISGHFALDASHGLLIMVTSFGFRNGVPREADLVFDVRFLENPYYDEKLRPLTGKDPAVAKKVASDPDFPKFFENLQSLVEPLLPRYLKEGKSYLTIAIGCTGGRHRSVFTAEELFKWIDTKGYSVGINHRDSKFWALKQNENKLNIDCDETEKKQMKKARG